MIKINKVGFEIEAMFDSDGIEEVASKFMGEVKDDGSLRGCDEYRDCGGNAKSCWDLCPLEFNSPPIARNKLEKEIPHILSEIEKYDMCWNKSCGVHVHVSFKGNANMLVSREFVDFFISKFKAKFPEEYKERKDNEFCVPNNTKIALLHSTGGLKGLRQVNGRYYFVNYYNLTNRRSKKTIEFRCFPTNDLSTIENYVWFCVDTLEKYIEKLNKAPIEIKRYVTDKNESKTKVVKI